jgi:membrane-associated phospholipid phosphatase
MSRTKEIWSVPILLGLVFCSQHVVSQQIIHISNNILSDTLSSSQFKYSDYDNEIYKENTAIFDNILLKQEFKLLPADYTFLLAEFNPVPDSLVDKPKWFLASMLEDEGKLWTSPFRIRKEDLKFWIPIITATALSIVYDEEIYSAIKNFQNQHAWVSVISPVITRGGEVFPIEAGALFVMSGLIFHNEKAKQTGFIALQTWVHAGLIVQVGKLIFGRQRPSYENGVDKWHGFPESLNRFRKDGSVSKYDAFPSGHTIEAFGLATVIAEQYKNIKIVPIISYSLAAGVGLSRITEDTHWLSDVILGAAMGYGIGKYMVRERKDTKWTLIPQAAKDDLKLTAICRF